MPSDFEPKAKAAYDYQAMLRECGTRCWWCGTDALKDRPAWWAGPWFLHRAHIVNSPRVEDRRAVVLLCPVCHGLHHGEKYQQLPEDWPAPDLPGLLWIKRRHDPQWYDRAWLQRHSLRKLPKMRRPKILI